MADIDYLEEAIGEIISNARQKLELPILIGADVEQLVHAHSIVNVFEAEVVDGNFEASTETLLKKIEAAIGSEDASVNSQDALVIRQSILNRLGTHYLVRINNSEPSKLAVTITIFFFYVELDNIGPILDGDIVMQGVCIDKNLAPAYCTVEYAKNKTSEFIEVFIVGPWKMIVPVPEDNDSSDVDLKFTIPISIPEEYRGGGLLRARVYLDNFSSIPYESETESYVMTPGPEREKLICAVSVICNVPQQGEYGDFVEEGRRSGQKADGEPEENPENEENAESASAAAEQAAIDAAERASEERMMQEYELVTSHSQSLAGEGETSAKQVVKDIRIASDFDDVVQYQSYGFELMCTNILPSGPVMDQDQLWKFYIMASFGPYEEGGVEDIIWLKTLKSVGTLPSVPLFKIFHDHDLSEPDDEFSVYLAVKSGSNPRFTRLEMISGLLEEGKCFDEYVQASGGEFKAAPAEISRQVEGGRCGILLVPLSSSKVYGGSSVAGGSVELSQSMDGVAFQEGKSLHGDDSDDEEEDFDDDDENEIILNLTRQAEALTNERSQLLQLNTELQKKAVALIAREKMIMGLTGGAGRTSATQDGVGTGTADAALVPDAPDIVTVEQTLEKEKQYQDVLQLIVDERSKLTKQQREFDQLALDLQTRLDDKEFKANGISSSFKQFKKEILSKAENSRTGQTVPKTQMKQFELAEAKREEDLERVRLRNISLRTTFRKLERQLRSREQLAEGLHMIDFEQLKIENQTLNEKIEERNEDLAKLKRKKTTTVQVLTHVREKLRFVELANEVVQADLSKLENEISTQRNSVALRKLDRDSMRVEGKELKAKQGFSNSTGLLEDFEKRKAKNEELKASISELKNRYSILMMQVMKTSTSQSGVGGGLSL